MFGISQSGRFVRNFIELGMNKDLSGRRVFDGALAHTAGAGKVFANTTFAEPSRTATQHEDRLYPENWFPFSTAMETDPASGRTGSLFRGDGSDPLLIATNTSTDSLVRHGNLKTDPFLASFWYGEGIIRSASVIRSIFMFTGSNQRDLRLECTSG